MQTLTYEYKLDPTPKQSQAFEQWLETCRNVYKYALRERQDWVNSRKCSVNACSLKQEYILPADAPRLTFYSQCRTLAGAKETNPNLKIPHTHALLQQVLLTLEVAFVAMSERVHGFPRFQKRMCSFVYPQLNKVPVKGDRVNLPKIGWVKMRLSRLLPSGYQLKQVRVVRRASGFYAMLTLQSPVEVPQATLSGYAVGIEIGLQNLIATSEGELVARPRFFVDGQRQLKLLQRQLKHQTRGSRESQRLQRRIARHHESISNARKDFHFKTADRLCDNPGMIFAFDLNLKAMSAGMLCKHTLDPGFGQFLSILGMGASSEMSISLK